MMNSTHILLLKGMVYYTRASLDNDRGYIMDILRPHSQVRALTSLLGLPSGVSSVNLHVVTLA